MSSNHRKRYQRNGFNLELIVSLLIIMATTLGTTIPMYLHSNSLMYANMKETNANITAIHEEMKDFHGRLCAIEERNRR
jgi:cell division protein FtsB